MDRPLLTGAVALVLTAGPAMAAEKAEVIETYMAIAEAKYADSLASAERLGAAVRALVAEPSAQSLAAARAAWIAARVPYQQTEVYRFGNAIVDDWEGRVNAWPLDEGLIDYVDGAGATDENPYGALNIVASAELTVSGRSIDATTISAALIEELHQLDAIEANVTTGLPRHRVSALGPGPERHRPRRGRAALDRLCRRRRLHQRPLRPARAVPHRRHRAPDRRSRLDGRRLGPRRRGPRRTRRQGRGRSDHRHAHWHGQPFLWRAGG